LIDGPIIVVGIGSLSLVASRKTRDGGDPKEALDEWKEGPGTMGAAAFLVHFWAVKKNTGLSEVTFIIFKKIFFQYMSR
jgi:hypothetical protein